MDDYYEPNKSMATLETELEHLKTKIMNSSNYKMNELEEANTTQNEFFKEYVLNKYPNGERQFNMNLKPPAEAMDVVYTLLNRMTEKEFLNKLGDNTRCLVVKYARVYRTTEWFKKTSELSGIEIENIRMKFYGSSLVNIFKSYMGFTPLKHTFTFKNVQSKSVTGLFNEILQITTESNSTSSTSESSEDSGSKDEVIVFGYSWGGAIVNRLAIIMQKYNYDFSNVHLACFGSTYVAPTHKISRINLINYMSTSDLAIKANWLGSRFTRRKNRSFFKVIPWFSSFTKLLKWKTINICAFEETIDKLKWICMYRYQKDKPNEPLCTKNGKDRRVPYTDNSDHDYDKLMECILSYNLNTISLSQLSKHSFIHSLSEPSGFITDISMFTPDDPRSNDAALLIEDFNHTKNGGNTTAFGKRKPKITLANKSRHNKRRPR
jgi:hypothetical protein